ncbi:MAG TPA: hypothetical protein V6C65_01690 [Allocoleopsis sp.]
MIEAYTKLLDRPMNRECLRIIGRLFRIQDYVVTAHVRRRMIEIYGQRPAPLKTTGDILKFLVEENYAARVKRGCYKPIATQITPQEGVELMVALYRANGGEPMRLDALQDSPILFPFKFDRDMQAVWQKFDTFSLGLNQLHVELKRIKTL